MATRLVTLACAGCSAPVTVPADVRRFTCSHCGASLRVEESGGAVFTRELERLADDVERLKLRDERRRLVAERKTLAASAHGGAGVLAPLLCVAIAVVGLIGLAAFQEKAARRNRAAALAPLRVMAEESPLFDAPPAAGDRPRKTRRPRGSAGGSRSGAFWVVGVPVFGLAVFGCGLVFIFARSAGPDPRSADRLGRINGRLDDIDARLRELAESG